MSRNAIGEAGFAASGQLVAAGFEPVAEAFSGSMVGRAGGAALCVYLDGVPVVDVWGGTTYGPKSLQHVFSVTKGVTSICVATLVQDGRLGVDRPVAELWPEFGAAGKREVTVGDVMSHRAGLPALEMSISLPAWGDGRVAERLAAQAPLWSPVEGHGYHPWTFGALADALVRRVDGRSVGRYLAEEIAARYDLELWIGLPAELEDRVVPLVIPSDPVLVEQAAEVPELAKRVSALVRRRAMRSSDYELAFMNTREAHEVELAAVNGIGSARALARLYAACVSDVDGSQLLTDETIAEVTTPRSEGIDLVNLEESRFGLGFQLPTERLPMAGDGSFGHSGMGGCLAFAQSRLGLAFAFVTDVIPPTAGADPATTELIETTLRCLDVNGGSPADAGAASLIIDGGTPLA